MMAVKTERLDGALNSWKFEEMESHTDMAGT
jgi:hypothetical protein